MTFHRCDVDALRRTWRTVPGRRDFHALRLPRRRVPTTCPGDVSRPLRSRTRLALLIGSGIALPIPAGVLPGPLRAGRAPAVPSAITAGSAPLQPAHPGCRVRGESLPGFLPATFGQGCRCRMPSRGATTWRRCSPHRCRRSPRCAAGSRSRCWPRPTPPSAPPRAPRPPPCSRTPGTPGGGDGGRSSGGK